MKKLQKGIKFTKEKDCILKKPWRASFMKDYKHIHIGYFGTKEEAMRAYNEAVKEPFGEFASFNQIGGGI